MDDGGTSDCVSCEEDLGHLPNFKKLTLFFFFGAAWSAGKTDNWEAAEESRDMVDWLGAGDRRWYCKKGDWGGRERDSGDREVIDLFWE